MTQAVMYGGGDPFAASVNVPGDKSLSHRGLVFAGMANGESRIRGLGTGADVRSSAEALVALGVEFSADGLDVIVSSPGVEGWTSPGAALNCGNSGTTMRMMAGCLAGRSFSSELIGDESLSRRPMARLRGPLESLGATVLTAEGGRPPIVVGPSSGLVGVEYVLDKASAQLRSAFELAALQAEGDSAISSPFGYRDHTERWLETLGLGEKDGDRFVIYPGGVPPHEYLIPGDASSAAFLWTAAAIVPGAEVVTPDVTLNAGRIGFLEILERMGAVVSARVDRAVLGDAVGTVSVKGGALTGTEVSGSLVAAALDELPLVAVLGAYAEGVTTVRDAAELRVKESDRVATTCAMIRALGGGAEESDDGFQVIGLGWLDGGTVASAGDHRIAMAAGVAATRARAPVTIMDADVAAVSWPDFYETMETLWSSR